MTNEQPPVYDVVTTEHRLKIPPGESGSIPFTITNQGSEPLNSGIKVRTEGDLQQSWCQVDGPAERELSPNDGVHYTLKVDVPADAPIGSSKVTLTVYSINEPETLFTRGSWVQIDHAKLTNWPKWLIPVLSAAGVVIVALVILLWWVFRPATVAFDAEPASGVAPLTVTFTAQTNRRPKQWDWDFDTNDTEPISENNTPKKQVREVQFNSTGTFRVKMSADFGKDNSVEKTVDIKVMEPVIAVMSVDPPSCTGHSPLEVTFTNNSLGAERCEWSIEGEDELRNGDEEKKTFRNDGTDTKKFEVKLKVFGKGKGDIDSTAKIVEVMPKIKGDFYAEPTTGYPDLKVKCRPKVSQEFESATWKWYSGIEGDPPSSEHDPTFVYTKDGTYDLKLELTPNNGDSTITTRKIEVYKEPELTFDASPTSIPSNGSVTFKWKINGPYSQAYIDLGRGLGEQDKVRLHSYGYLARANDRRLDLSKAIRARSDSKGNLRNISEIVSIRGEIWKMKRSQGTEKLRPYKISRKYTATLVVIGRDGKTHFEKKKIITVTRTVTILHPEGRARIKYRGEIK